MVDSADNLATSVAKLSNLLLLHVIPLFNIRPGKRPDLIGSSLLVASGTNRFLVSARHVIDKITEPGGLHYYIEPGMLHKLYGTVLRTIPLPGQSELDPYDLAIILLSSEAKAPANAVWKTPLNISSLRRGKLPRTRKQYLVVGFPASRSKANPHNRRLKSESSGFRVISANRAAYESLGLSEQEHLVLNLDIENMIFPDGSIRRIPDPHGMSGAPVWMLFDEDGCNDVDTTPTVGIVIEYHKKSNLLVATDIGVALDLIAQSLHVA
ncbi:MAG: hypothetical protein M0Z73_09850 [Betaproteobacteria bacterium]|nr:hypothetical protein [Betaproteobacteria bacterium]